MNVKKGNKFDDWLNGKVAKVTLYITVGGLLLGGVSYLAIVWSDFQTFTETKIAKKNKDMLVDTALSFFLTARDSVDELIPILHKNTNRISHLEQRQNKFQDSITFYLRQLTTIVWSELDEEVIYDYYGSYYTVSYDNQRNMWVLWGGYPYNILSFNNMKKIYLLDKYGKDQTMQPD